MGDAHFRDCNEELWGLLPENQVERVMGQYMCDIDPEFLGFVDIYRALSNIIPKHYTIVDLGCAYAPQAFFFSDHARYIGVDMLAGTTFETVNSSFFKMPIAKYIERHADDLDMRTTFAICSYVPPWRDDNMKLARENFTNVFSFYPARAALQEE